eukprot:CAMPEP_0113553646 /NCGR_PEP_ID=MMETSP0015_2-20120614/15726_1 /TAXON_ID=2838 /ORGANISM="Odontella" /LENGTH=842 /DNA_ID=CAMNT_0000454733 /DNA_START=13 /DNA_END=2541 /DNA_ORIENTATION=- /assembly_acc=CAM_ASM_000160
MANPAEDEATVELRLSLNAAVSSWSKFDLTSRRPILETSASSAREYRDQSQAARKALGDLTKSFKKSVKGTEASAAALRVSHGSGGAVTDEAEALLSSVDGLAKSCRSTVKSYQEEIDHLTRRCKASDSAFLDLFKAIVELPDPAPVMRAGVGDLDSRVGQVNHLLRGMEEMHNEMGGMSDENEQLRKQVEELKKEVVSANAQIKVGKTGEGEVGGLNKEEKEELIQLRRDVSEYEVEFRGLKNQDITIRKLEKKIEDMQKSNEEELEKQLKKAQEDLAETEGRRATEALEREAALERKLQSVELELRAERAGRDAAHTTLLEADEGASAREAAWEAQRQILVDDAERLRETLQEAVAERDDLRLRVAALVGTEGGNESSTGLVSAVGSMGIVSPPVSGAPFGISEMLAERKAFEAEVSELTLTATSLREELKAKDESIAEERRNVQTTVDSLEKERMSLSSTVADLNAQISNAPSRETVENMKRELRILKRLEYNAVDADADRDPEMTTFGQEDRHTDLESVLVAKLKRVESELVTERRERNERTIECDALRQQLLGAEKARADSDALVAALEADLERAITAGAPSAEGQPVSTNVKKVPLPMKTKSDPAALQRVLERSDSPPPRTDAEVLRPVSTSAVEKASDDHSVATIVMAQRDRLRARCDALEAERDSFKRELQVQVASAESLKADNTKLYEKVRYLQNFSNNNGPSSAGMRSRQALADRDLDLEALEQRYEASVDPFRQFGRAERQRKLKEMSPMERFVFIVAKIVLGSKEMRTALFFYMLGMHLLVFITTYHWSHELGCEDMHLHEDLAHFHGAVPLENKYQGLDGQGDIGKNGP